MPPEARDYSEAAELAELNRRLAELENRLARFQWGVGISLGALALGLILGGMFAALR